MRLITAPILLITIIFISFKLISSNSQFCSTLHTTTKQDNCPNPVSFDILKEYSKSLSSWRLNTSILNNKSDLSIIEEIKKRFNQGISCPYIRQTNKTICCEGWQGLACDQPNTSLTQQSFASCHLWDQDHIRTFDGTYYQFPGSCTYKLTGAMTWQINIQFINCTTRKDSCEKKLTIVISGKTLEIIGTKLNNLTTYPSSLTIRRQEKNLLDLYFTNGIRLKIDQNQRAIIIQFDKNLLTGQTLSGLCGDYNNNQDDDLKLVTTGAITSSPVDFGNQWKVDRSCPDVPPVLNDCSITTAAVDQCISLTNQSQIFQSCFAKVDPKYFYETCLNDVCSALLANKSSTSVRCRALEAYAEECQEHNIHIQWRSQIGCSKHCPSRNMIYSDCVSACPRTCHNPTLSNTQCHTQNTACTSGCVCSNETVYDSFQDECIQLEKCTCQYNNIQYQPGDHVSMDCNDCRCDHGRWLCTNQTCPRTCLVLGNMNVLTFDGKRYALVSSCNQVLVETNDQSNYLRITYTHQGNELNIQILNTKIVLHQNDVLINGNIRHSLPYQTDNVIIRRASTVFIEVRDIQSTVVVHFDSLTSRIYVKLNPSFVNRVRGLCGTFNYITNDDFLTPNNVIETNLVTFANAYLASSCSISDQQIDTCFNYPANEQHAKLECTNLLKHPIFSTCSPSIIDPIFFLSSCIRDLCADQSSNHHDQVKCSVITALAHACALKGIFIDWMKNKTLARTCQKINYGQCGSKSQAKYSECVSECQSACTDIDLMPSSCINQCLPGCTCRSGQFYDEHSHVCRTRNECPCYESQSEQYIHPSHSLLLKTPILSNCSCSNGSLQCTSFNNIRCSSSQIYSTNTTLCPRTCANYLSRYDCGLYGPGCTCPSDKILLDSTSQCLPIDQCPCQYNRQFYLVNETIIQNKHGCQNCTCQKGGLWSCQKISCTKTCTMFAHSHYQTFDGLYYNFPGQCQYILVQDSKNLFRIVTQNIPCGTNGKICSKNILIEYNGVSIDLIRGRSILFNDIELSNYRIQPVTFGNIHIYQLGIYTIIKTDDFMVKWDEQTYVEIAVQSNNEMAGLCGNNNDNFDDDLKSSNGATQISIFDMAKSWQTSAQCTSINNQSISDDPCVDHTQRRTWAQNKCDLIKIKSSITNNPFEICIEKMETSLIEKYYQACLYDACHADHGGDCESVCTVLSAFAAECQSIIKKSIPKWRTADRCPVQCDSGKVYMSCGPLCPQSCFEGDDYGGCIADSGCVDGCFCPNGKVMDNNGQCIEPPYCPCLYNNNIYPQSSRIIMQKNETCHHECECQNGSFICDDQNAMTTCITTNCTSNQFTCPSDGQCIPFNWECDGIEDCLDGSDELKLNCQNQCLNRTKTFQCSTGQCIDIMHRCDGLFDCRDGSDEVNCSYVIPCQEYQCPISKLCIPKTWICDGTVDCGHEDDSDESGDCKLNQCDTLSGRYFQCRDNFNCLPIEQRCDAHKDCNDGSDELNCSSCTCTSSFSCIHTCQCIDSRRVCDGISDCIDGTDEFNCMANCSKDEYTCLDGKCLERKFLCDGIRHCLKGEDETYPDCTAVSTTPTSISTPVPTTIGSTTAKPTCDIQSALINDRYISHPEFSTPILGPMSDLNPGGKGIDFVVNTPSTAVTIILPLKDNVILINLVKFQLLRPSNVNQFRLTFLNKQKQPIGQYQILSTDSKQSSTSPTIDQFPIETNLFKKIRFVKIDILDTDDNRPPKRVTILFQACFKQTKTSQPKNCTQIDAMNSLYTTRIIAKLGGTHTLNSSYGNLLQDYGGVTYNTSQAVIDIRFHTYILSRIDEISIPDYALNRTNVRKIIVELFDRYHQRLFWNQTNTMKVLVNSTKKIHVRFIRISILETNDNYAPFNVTVSVKGCFYRKYSTKKHTTRYTKTPTTTPKSTCYRANALDPQYAHKIIGQFEGTQPLPGLSYLNFIEPSETGVNYGTKSPIVLIRFQANVVGQLDEISLINSKDNIKQFQIDLFDFNNNLLFSNQTIYPARTIQIPSTSINNPLFVSTIEITILNTIDDRPASGIILSIIGCYSTFPRISTTTTTATTTVAPKTTTPTRKPPRKCHRLELMNSSNIIIGVTSKSTLTNGSLGNLGRSDRNGVTFSDIQPSVDLIFRSNILIYLNSISIISSTTNLNRFRIELLNNENYIQYKVESSSMTVNLESLPSMILAGIRLTFLQTTDNQPPKNILLSIQACVEEILIQTSPTTTPPSTTRRISPKTTPITPDHCADIDAMQEPYSEKTLAGLSGTNPRGTNASLLDLINGKSISFDQTEDEIVLFVIFKSDLFVYLKYVGVSSLSESNVKQIKIEYLDKNQLLQRKIFVDYSNNQTGIEPIDGVGSLKITIEETFDGKPARNVRLSVRGCFGIQPQSTTSVQPRILTTTPTPSTPCHDLNLMSNQPVVRQVIAYIAGTNPISSSIFDYFNSSISISYTQSSPTFIIVFKTNIYVELKSILITSQQTNVRKYKIDLIDYDQTILQTIIIDTQQNQSKVNFYVPIGALQITYLETTDGQAPRNIILNIDGCFGINLAVTTTPTTTTQRPPMLTATHCHVIDMMNKLDSTILVDSITGTLPRTELRDYFNQTSSISYNIQQASPIIFLIILKSTVYAEIQSITLINSLTNVKRFRVDLIDDYKSIVQTIESNENLTADGLTEVGIAAIQITYLETNDNQPPKDIQLAIRGCFGILPTRRRTTKPQIQSTTTTTKAPQTTKRKCTMLDAMTIENRNKLLQSIGGNESLGLFSSNGLSLNSTYGSVAIAFKPGIISNMENISIIGNENNIKNYRITFYDIDNEIIGERLLRTAQNEAVSVDNVATIRIEFLETIDNKTIKNVKLSVRGCFFQIPNFKPSKSTTPKPTKPPGYCHLIDLMDKHYAKRLLSRIGGSINLPEVYNSTQTTNQSLFFILEFHTNIFIRNIQNISILSKNHHIQQIRIELYNKNRQLLKHLDLSMFEPTLNTNLYTPVYPIHVKYLKVTILKGTVSENTTWSIVGCFDRVKKIKTIIKTLKYAWWTVSCIHSNILASHRRKFLTPYITGTPLPIEDNFDNLLSNSLDISYSETQTPIIIEIIFPPGIIGRLYEVGIRSSNVYRIRVQLVEVPNGLLYTLTSPHYNTTEEKNTNPRLTGFPPVHSSAIRVILLDTIDGRAPRHVKIYTNGCFYKSSVKYTALPTIGTTTKTSKRPKTSTTIKPTCHYSEWTLWRHCSVSCGNGVQIRARNRLSGTGCNDSLIDYRMCQLQPCMCVLTKEFYTAATGQKVPADNIVGYLKDGTKPVHIGDILDTGTIVYTYDCLQFICSNIGLDMKHSSYCQYPCLYLPWSSWSSCQGHCGNQHRKGFQFRQRLPLHILTGSHLCQSQRENRSCQTSPCFGSCILSSWSKWSTCSKPCDLGSQKRSRYYLSVQPNCTDNLEESRDCNPQCCLSKKEPTWSEWSPWGNCSQTCNGGERIRYRTCKNDTSQCKQQLTCKGSDKQIEPCNTEKCPNQVECTNGKVMNNCSNACGYKCNTLPCRSCNEPSTCLPGCVCPAPLVLNAFGECIETNQCLCQTSDGKTNLVSGQSITDSKKCEDCSCSNGCLNCRPSSKVCSTCQWSDWTPFGVCSDKCNGTQRRYRSRSCIGLTPEFDYENQTCSTNETFYKKGCAQCSCNTTTGEETCHVQCAITPSVCANITNDPFAIYEYIPPTNGQCCGSCHRTNKTEPCSVRELPFEQVSSGDCVSINRIARQQCLGTCISGMLCRCCSPSKISMEEISMKCQRIENNSTITFIEQRSYAKIDSCSCQECLKYY